LTIWPCFRRSIKLFAFESKINVVIDLDDINQDLIDLLQRDARMSYRELGEAIGLSAPAVAERVRKLEEAGVITGYHATVDYEAVGFPLLCIIRLNLTSGVGGALDEIIESCPEVIESNRVTGSESHVIRARVSSTEHLEELLHVLWEFGTSVTNIVTSSPVPRRPMNIRAALTRAAEFTH
jgi:Lrp/AsnC family leucine-responsive transcriptional regulator